MIRFRRGYHQNRHRHSESFPNTRTDFFMDRKTILVVVLCLGMLVGWHVLINKIYPPKPVPPGSTNLVSHVESALTNEPLISLNGTNSASGASNTVAEVTAGPAASNATGFNIDTNTPEEQIVLTNDYARYIFTSYGGGLKAVELTDYPESVRRGDRNVGDVATLNEPSPVPTLAVLDGDAVQGDGIFKLTRTATGIRAEKQLANGLGIVKDFVLSTNYLVSATIRLENRSAQPLSLPEQKWVIGTATPMNAEDRNAQASVGWIWNNGKKTTDTMGAGYFSARSFCMPRTPPAEYRAGGSNVVWAAVHNQFFALAVIPDAPAIEVVARPVHLQGPTSAEIQANPQLLAEPKAYEAAMVYPAVTIPANQALQREFHLFAGPKEYRTLARISSRFENDLDSIMGFGWFGFFSKGLLLGMNWLHDTLKFSYGWAIIAITFIIKTLFWPLTQASTRSMKRMQALQPQMKAIQEKYKEDPMKGQRKMMEFMKENKVNPMGGCLPMLLQMPVFFGFFYMIRSAIELRGASFLWVADLSRPDTLFIIPGLHFPFNLLPLLMGATMLWQAHLTPPSPGMDPMQQKIMRYMPLMFMVFLYNYSAGLTLYWTVQNLLTIVQTKLTKMRDEPSTVKAPALTTGLKRKK